MSTTRSTRRRRIESTRLIQAGLLGTLGAGLLAMVAGVAWLRLDSRETTEASQGTATSTAVQLPIANAPQVAAGVLVSEPAAERGKLPLDTTVRQVYELVNTGPGTAQLGQPTIEVLDGCCPPEPALSQSALAPGETALVAMSMQMHEGMDGPHLFHLTVPVKAGDTEDALHLYFKGDFGG